MIPSSVKAGDVFYVDVSVTNASDTVWPDRSTSGGNAASRRSRSVWTSLVACIRTGACSGNGIFGEPFRSAGSGSSRQLQTRV